MSSTLDEGVLRRIKKCLAMASDGRGNEAEAANALRMAQALMAKHGIEQKTLARADIGKASGKTGAWDKPAQWEFELAYLLSRAFGCQYMVTRWGGKGIQSAAIRKVAEIDFVGLHHQVELAAYAWAVVRRQAIRARADYVASIGGGRGEKIKAGESFIRGYINNIRRQVSELAVDPVHEEAIRDTIKEACGPNAKPIKVVARELDYEALHAGAQAGRDLTLHRPMDGAPEDRLALENGG